MARHQQGTCFLRRAEPCARRVQICVARSVAVVLVVAAPPVTGGLLVTTERREVQVAVGPHQLLHPATVGRVGARGCSFVADDFVLNVVGVAGGLNRVVERVGA